MKKIFIFTVILVALFFQLQTKQLSCLTGYKILVRQQTKDQQTGQVIYKLQNRCLCPNNYYGNQCAHHINVDCFLSEKNDKIKTIIDQKNAKQEMELEIEFGMDCWVGQKNVLKSKIKLQDFLIKYNSQNVFGIRQQFGKEIDIVWANTTDIFDSKGEFAIISDMKAQNQSYELTKQQKLKILIGNNTELYNTPFTYTDEFLGFGLINGKVRYELSVLDPQKGMLSLKNYTNKDVTISYENAKNAPSKRVTKAQQIPNAPIPNVNQTIKKEYPDQYEKLQYLLSNKGVGVQTERIALIKVPVKINPYNSTFYSSIKLSLSIFENYQSIVTHQISLNSFIETIPVEIPSIGYQPSFYKNLIVTSQSYKSYYKIILVVLIICVIYFGLTFGYKKWKERKEKFLQLTEQHINLEQISTGINK